MLSTFIKGYGERYTLYEDGRVQRNPGKFRRRTIYLKPKNDRYLRVCLYNGNAYKTYSIHRLIAEYFIPNPENKPCVNHIDGNRLNNDIKNLEWCTFKENLVHSIEVLGRKRNTKKQRETAKIMGKNKRKLTLHQAEEIRKLAQVKTRKELCVAYGVSLSTIDCIVQNKRYLD